MVIDIAVIFYLLTAAVLVAQSVFIYFLRKELTLVSKAGYDMANTMLILVQNQRQLDRELVEQKKLTEKFNR